MTVLIECEFSEEILVARTLVFYKPSGTSTVFFVNLLDTSTRWEKVSDGMYEVNRSNGSATWTATPVDLILDLILNFARLLRFMPPMMAKI